MGNLMFLLLHFTALMFGMFGLLVTIPMHMLYSVSKSRAKVAKEQLPTPKTHLNCPDCKEFVLKGAIRCKHCGCELSPYGIIATSPK